MILDTKVILIQQCTNSLKCFIGRSYCANPFDNSIYSSIFLLFDACLLLVISSFFFVFLLNISHTLTELLILLSVEINKICHLKQFFRQIFSSRLIAFIAIFSSDRGFLINILFKLV